MKVLSEGENDVDAVVHLFDDFERNAQDVHWITEISKAGRWCIISSDRFNKHHRAEREALRHGGHLIFVLEKQWSGQPYWVKAERFIVWWPQIIATSMLVDSGMFAVPFVHRTGTKFKPIRL